MVSLLFPGDDLNSYILDVLVGSAHYCGGPLLRGPIIAGSSKQRSGKVAKVKEGLKEEGGRMS